MHAHRQPITITIIINNIRSWNLCLDQQLKTDRLVSMNFDFSQTNIRHVNSMSLANFQLHPTNPQHAVRSYFCLCALHTHAVACVSSKIVHLILMCIIIVFNNSTWIRPNEHYFDYKSSVKCNSIKSISVCIANSRAAFARAYVENLFGQNQINKQNKRTNIRMKK